MPTPKRPEEVNAKREAIIGGFQRDWFLGAILVLSVILVYSPVWWAGYVWDDDKYITANPVLIGPLGLADIWTSRIGDSCPVTMTTWWVGHALWGMNPLPYHLLNVLLQAACGVMLWRVLLRLQVPGAWLGSALWALHPLQVESVAWISEMKNTESGLFFLLSIFYFIRWLNPPGEGTGWDYIVSLIFAALAMGSKSSTVILPAVLCLVAWWIEGRWSWKNLVKVAPFLIMSILAGALAIWTFQLQVNPDPLAARGWPERWIDGGLAVWSYLGKLIWPDSLCTIYPGWTREGTSWLSVLAIVVLLLLLSIKRDSSLRGCFFAFAYYLTALFPALGIVSQSFVHYSVVADHLQYLAGIGPLALVGAGLNRLAEITLPGKIALQTGLSAGLLAGLGFLSWKQAWKYESPRALWTDAVVHNPGSFTALTNLGNALVQEGRPGDALVPYVKALTIDTKSAQGYSNFAGALLLQGQVNEAIASYEMALKLDPSRARSEVDLAFAYNRKGQTKEAIEHYHKSLALDPKNAEAHFNLGNLLLQSGRTDEAMTEYINALTFKPDYAEAHYNLGNVLIGKGREDEAINEYEKALAVRPNYAEVHNNLGAIRLRHGLVPAAIDEFRKAVNANPNFTEAQKNLALAESMLR